MTDDTPAVKTTKDDAYREAFLRNTLSAMIEKMGWDMNEADRREICAWLRTVWLEARGEEWGEGVEVGGGEAW